MKGNNSIYYIAHCWYWHKMRHTWRGPK